MRLEKKSLSVFFFFWVLNAGSLIFKGPSLFVPPPPPLPFWVAKILRIKTCCSKNFVNIGSYAIIQPSRCCIKLFNDRNLEYLRTCIYLWKMLILLVGRAVEEKFALITNRLAGCQQILRSITNLNRVLYLNFSRQLDT